ncbi:12006_t:CDS:2 [Ambispora leptoticha]|uniref:12006_t:CDS:1 n=1 Tax=Ambispora leptoticha TaxID=144679 RepID=A0A9N9A119_9GLOM|nr:12006_t:CDS:2 [Ambispora leptoticha]
MSISKYERNCVSCRVPPVAVPVFIPAPKPDCPYCGGNGISEGNIPEPYENGGYTYGNTYGNGV